MVIFNPETLISTKKIELQERVSQLKQSGKAVSVVALMYQEDRGSQLYTAIKRAVAEELGILYTVEEFSLAGGVEKVMDAVRRLNADPMVTGIIIQKPTRKMWASANYLDGKEQDIKKAYDTWWHLQTSLIDPKKDVDGLNPSIIGVIENGQLSSSKRVLPATVRAVLSILESSNADLNDKKIAILGKSDLLGIPLYYYFLSKNYLVKNLGRSELEVLKNKNLGLKEFDIVISATGVKNLITSDLLKIGSIVIDVGEPKGDVDFDSVKSVASFLTPVPGGVGPMTVICLMENACDII